MTTPPLTAGLPGRAKGRRNRRLWWILSGAIVLVLIGTSVAVASFSQAPAEVASSDVTVLTAGPLQDSVSATGTVASANTTKVYSTQTYAVTEIYVEVGSVVANGDRLLALDRALLNKQVSAKTAAMDQTAATAAAALRTAQNNYDAAAAAIANGTNAAINAAEAQATAAYNAWQRAEKSYDDFRDAYLAEPTQNAQVLAARIAKEAACLVDPAPAGCETATDQLAAAENAAENTISDLKLAADAAEDSYAGAQDSLAAAKAGAEAQLQSAADAINSARAQGSQTLSLTDLANLQSDLDATLITAPVAGTVTAIYAKVGANGAGLALVIEDVDNLVIESTVKEYDVNTVRVGMPVTIESDATRDALYEGTLVRIDPASTKDPQGETLTGGDVLYGTRVEVTSQETKLRIGMSVRISYVVEKADDVLAVPYDALFTNAQGGKSVLVAIEESDGRYRLRELPVTTGLENDLSVAISGPGIASGVRVVNSPTKLKADTLVSITG